MLFWLADIGGALIFVALVALVFHLGKTKATPTVPWQPRSSVRVVTRPFDYERDA